MNSIHDRIQIRRSPWVLILAVMVLLFAGSSRATAAITSFPLPTAASAPVGITAGPDGNVWAVESAASRVVRIRPSGQTTEFTLPAGREPLDIVSAGGLLWWTERAGDRIGRLDPGAGGDGAIQSSIVEFAVPGAGSQPTSIAAGPDGALWFTQAGGDQIGRLTSAGVVTNEFLVPGAGSTPTGIATGPDGALWFTEAGSAEVGRITTAGVITEFPVPTLTALGTRLGSIAAGPDGALWMVDSGLDHVRRITTSGVSSGFAGPAGSGLSDIATGPDGALWLTEGRSGKIARLTTGGALSEYSLPNRGAGPSGIGAGPDGALWFTQQLAGAIGRITTDTAPDALPTGPRGPQGPAGTTTLAVVAFQFRPARPRAGRRITVSYVVTGPARVALRVKRGRQRARTVARRVVRRAGVRTIAWNGRLARRRARPGRYVLIVRATRDGKSASSRLRVRLR